MSPGVRRAHLWFAAFTGAALVLRLGLFLAGDRWRDRTAPSPAA